MPFPLVRRGLTRFNSATFTGANADERDACPELIEGIKGLLLGDKGFIRPELTKDLSDKGIYLQTPLRDNMVDKRPRSFLRWMMGTRRLVETQGLLIRKF